MTLTQWFGERLPVSAGTLRELTNEPVPWHLKRWWFALGGTPAYLFVVQIATGILLAFYYEASAGRAYESVRFITEEAAYGWYLTLLLGFTGYSLVFEQLSYWGATVGANITDTVPVVGGLLKNLLLAGETYNDRTLARFFILHAAVLPVALIALIAVHIVIVRLQGVTELRFERERAGAPETFRFFPDHLYTELIIGLVLMILLSTLATILPATLGPPADPLSTPEVIKPEWFFYVAFRWLKLFAGTTAVLSLGFIVFLMFAWPFVDAWLRRRTPAAEASVWIGIAAVVVLVGLTVWEALAEH